MEILFKVLLYLHIAGGMTGLLAGTINIVRKKGDKPHKLVGKIFFYGMLINGLCSFPMAIIHPNYFLFIVGVFTLYMLGTGQRYLSLKKLHKGQKPEFIDWFLVISMLIFGVIFIVFGVYNLVKANNFGIVFIVFGFVGLNFVMADFKNFKGKIKDANYWLLAHIGRMTGTYIAALTAFLVVNIKFQPSFVVWLLPTVVFTPLIVKWSREFKGKKVIEGAN
jgi:uncharacterized membrane protein